MKGLTPEQLEVIRREHDRADADDLARRLGIPRKRVDEALESLARPAWHGREHPGLAVALALAILVAGWLGYRNNGSCSLHFDDNHAIAGNQAIRTLHRRINAASREGESPVRRARAWAGALGPTAQAIYEFNLYRMVTYWSFALTYHDHPLDEAKDDRAVLAALDGWHAANNRIHLLNGLLVMWVAWLTLTAPVFRRAPAAVPWPLLVAGLAGLLFVSHPMQAQAVTYLTQRTESLACTFYLLGLGLYATARRREHQGPRGAAPWRTGLVLGATGVLLGLGAVTATTDALQLGGLVRLSFVIIAAGLAAVVALVKRGDDEPVHAACTIGAFLAFALGLQTKEIVATLPFAVVAWDLLFVPAAGEARAVTLPGLSGLPGRPWAVRALARSTVTRGRDLGPWAAMVGGVSVLAVVFGGANFARKLMAEGVTEGGVGEAAAEQLTTLTYLLTQQNVVCTYLRMFLLPYGQHLDHDYAIVPATGALGHGVTWLALLSGLLLLATAGLALWRGGRARVPAFALIAGLLVLGPTSSVIVLPDVIYEHRFYVPLAFAAVAALVTLERALRLALPDGRRAAALAAITLPLAALGVVLTERRNEAFRDEVSLWRDNTEKSPRKPRGWTNLGLAYQNIEPTLIQHQGEVRGGRAIRLPNGTILVHSTTDARKKPRVVQAGEPLGVAPVEGGPELAMAAYHKALELEPRYTKALNNLAIIHINLAKIERYQIDALEQLGRQAAGEGRADLAEASRKEAQERRAAFEQHRKAALAMYERVCDVHPKDGVPWSNRANLLAELWGDYLQAIACMTRALQLGVPEASICTLGEYYRAQGERVYMETQAAGGDALAAARSWWNDALVIYEKYLLTGDPTFRDTAQVRLKTVREWTEGKIPTAPGAPPPGPPR